MGRGIDACDGVRAVWDLSCKSLGLANQSDRDGHHIPLTCPANRRPLPQGTGQTLETLSGAASGQPRPRPRPRPPAMVPVTTAFTPPVPHAVWKCAHLRSFPQRMHHELELAPRKGKGRSAGQVRSGRVSSNSVRGRCHRGTPRPPPRPDGDQSKGLYTRRGSVGMAVWVARKEREGGGSGKRAGSGLPKTSILLVGCDSEFALRQAVVRVWLIPFQSFLFSLCSRFYKPARIHLFRGRGKGDCVLRFQKSEFGGWRRGGYAGRGWRGQEEEEGGGASKGEDRKERGQEGEVRVTEGFPSLHDSLIICPLLLRKSPARHEEDPSR